MRARALLSGSPSSSSSAANSTSPCQLGFLMQSQADSRGQPDWNRKSTLRAELCGAAEKSSINYKSCNLPARTTDKQPPVTAATINRVTFFAERRRDANQSFLFNSFPSFSRASLHFNASAPDDLAAAAAAAANANANQSSNNLQHTRAHRVSHQVHDTAIKCARLASVLVVGASSFALGSFLAIRCTCSNWSRYLSGLAAAVVVVSKCAARTCVVVGRSQSCERTFQLGRRRRRRLELVTVCQCL